MYKITDYEELYMPTDSRGRELVNATWVKVPAKPRGNGLDTLLRKKDGLKVFAVWILLLESTTAQKKGTRGVLNNHKDEPASVKEIAKSMLLDKQVKFVEYSIKVLTQLGWIIDDGVRTESVQGTLFGGSKSRVEKSSVVNSRVEKGFVPPTLEQLNLYIQEKQLNVDSVKFLRWYIESNWMTVENKPVKNWKLKLLSWDGNSTSNGRQSKPEQQNKTNPKALGYAARYKAKVEKLQAAGKYKPGMRIEV